MYKYTGVARSAAEVEATIRSVERNIAEFVPRMHPQGRTRALELFEQKRTELYAELEAAEAYFEAHQTGV